MRFIYSLLFIFVLCTTGYSQLNLSVLYAVGLTEPKTHQSIIDQFKNDNPSLESEFKDMKWVNGYGLGLRYKFDLIALNVRWENLINQMSTSGTDLNSDAFEQTLYFKMSSYSVGIESFFAKNLSIHASFDFSKVRYRTEVTDVADRFEIMNDWGTGSTFSIGYNLVGNGLMHVSLRPYVRFGWDEHDLSELNSYLNPSTASDLNLEEDFMVFGLKIIFYNGIW